MKENISDETLKEKKYTEERFLEGYIPQGLSTFSREVISKGVRTGRRRGRLKYKWFGKPPDGYNLDRNKKLLKNDRVLLIELIFKKYDAIENIAQIAFDLNKSEIKSSKGKKWTATQVHRILTNPIYKGLYKVKDMEAYVPDYKIISSKLFDRVNKKLGRGRKQSTMPKERKEEALDKIFNPYLEQLKQLEIPSERIVDFKPEIDKESLFYPREDEPALTRMEKIRLRLLIHLEEICKLLERDKVLDEKSVDSIRQITDELNELFKKKFLKYPDKRKIIQESFEEERKKIKQLAIEKREFLDEVVR